MSRDSSTPAIPKLLERILATPSPTGKEQRKQRMLRDWARSFADDIVPDAHGNLDIVINPGEDRPTVMLAAHCDQIGFLVMDIGDDGFLRVEGLGGVDAQTFLGATVTVHGQNGPVPGVVGKTAVHIQEQEDNQKTPKVEDVWIDLGVTSREEAESLVAKGNAVTFEPRIVRLTGKNGSRIASPAIDNGAGLYVVMEVARRCAEETLEVELRCVSTVAEEIGSRGAETAAHRIRPDIPIAVDTTLSIDDPGKPKKRTTPKLSLGRGPSISSGPNTSPVIAALLCAAAKSSGVNIQREPNAEAESNDAKPMQLADSGAATAAVGIPIRNMHTQIEVLDLADLDATVELLVAFVRSLKADTNLLPIDHDDNEDLQLGSQSAAGGKDAGQKKSNLNAGGTNTGRSNGVGQTTSNATSPGNRDGQARQGRKR